MHVLQLEQPSTQREDLMPVVRSADSPVDEGPGRRVQLIATPELAEVSQR